jgi:Tol biopolymer transport system component
VEPPRHDRQPGLRAVTAVWTLYLVVAAEVFATYSRTSPHELYHVSGNGRAAGAGRVLVFLNWPVALAAIPILAIVAAELRSRTFSRLAVVAGVLSAAVFWPGMVDQADLDARWANGIAGAGVLLALGLTVAAVLRRGLGRRTRAPGDRARVAIAVVLVLLALPWLAADLGFVIGRWPLFGSIYYSDEWYAPFGHARAHQAVHAGNHHGLVGALLVVTVLLLSRTLSALRPRRRALVGAYLAVLAMYGVAAIANDFWLEQIVKRGVTNWEFPSLITPKPTLDWLILLALAAVLYLLLFRRPSPALPVGDGFPRTSLAAVPIVALLLAIGLAHGSTVGHTRRGAADGIVFAAAPHGTSHLYVTRGGHVVQLTDAGGSDLAPAWSPDRRQIAFQSNRDGNWEIYTMRADGSAVRRLTNDDARDGEPGWAANGKRIAFTRDGDLYQMRSDGSDVRSLDNAGEWPAWSPGGELASDVPYGEHDYGLVINGAGSSLGTYGSADVRRPAWSPDGKRIAFECRIGTHWHVCVMSRSGRGVRYLTPHSSDAFAPAWSPDGRRIAFISDRDGPDELFVMAADGTAVLRITGMETDIDTPAWSRR